MEFLNRTAETIMDMAVFSVLPVAVLALFRLSTATREQRIITWFILFSAVCEITGYLVATQLGKYNLWVVHVVTLFRFPLLAWLYRDFYPRRFLLTLIVGFMVFAIFDSLFLEHFMEGFNPIGSSVESMLLLLLSIGFLSRVLRDLNFPRLEIEPLFWATCSIIIFFSASFLIILFRDFLLANGSAYFRPFYGLYALFLIVHYLLLGVALWVKPTTRYG